MRNAETVLAVIRERGKRGLPLEDVYRQLFNPELYLWAYDRLHRNGGAMTQGATPETVDGMALAKIEKLIEALRWERYRWTPVRRVSIPKKNGTTRPLGVPTWSDKLLQEVMRLLLEAYYEPQMSDHSHGFRPGRGCHTALQTVQHTWTGTKWFIEGDIKGCFDNIDHTVLLSLLREKVHDNRFIRLIENLLQAGYLEDWKYKPTLSGTPQGGVLSPLLSNIYLDRLDRFVEETLLPRHNQGARRKLDPAYKRLDAHCRHHLVSGRKAQARAERKRLNAMPAMVANDPDYRRLRYVRYADDFLLGFVGPRLEAEAIKEQLKAFLHESLKLELSPEKTLITHATTQAARFLGYDITCHAPGDKTDRTGRRITGRVSLRIPAEVVESRCTVYMKAGKPIPRVQLMGESDYAIILKYQAEYRGVVQYYAFAHNVAWLSKLHWIMETSLLKTLACKHQMSVATLSRKYRSTTATPHGPRSCLKAIVERKGKSPLVATFGGIPLVRRKDFQVLEDRSLHISYRPRSELLQRLLKEKCEVCGSTHEVQVHHVRRLKDLKAPGRRGKPLWMQTMSALRRKTLVVCHECHVAIHAGRPLKAKATEAT
jgi:group II intron reverse transcriptase/maturase